MIPVCWDNTRQKSCAESFQIEKKIEKNFKYNISKYFLNFVSFEF